MPPTGKTCQLTGVYRSECQHRLEVRFSRGDKFTPATVGQSTGCFCAETKSVAAAPLIVGGDGVRRIAQQEPQETV